MGKGAIGVVGSDGVRGFRMAGSRQRLGEDQGCSQVSTWQAPPPVSLATPCSGAVVPLERLLMMSPL